MVDIMGMMKKAQEMQAKMAEVQESLGNMQVEGRSGGGMVMVTLSGKGDLRGVKIDPALFKEDDVDVLEDLIIAAHAEAKAKVEIEVTSRMAEVTAGLPLPPGMKLPF